MTVSKFHDVLQHYQPDRRFPGAVDILARMERAPKFVFSDDVIDWLLLREDEYSEARYASIAAGHNELPRDPMLVEWSSATDGSARTFWLMEQAPGNGSRYQMWVALLMPGHGVSLPDRMFTCRYVGGREEIVADYTGPMPDGWEREPAILRSFKNSAVTAFCFAMALHVRGIVTRPPTPIDPKLARARLKRRLPPITKDYVTVHIGYITDKDGKRHDYQEGVGGHVRVHLRRGHERNQPCSPHSEDRRKIWIPATLVNWKPGIAVPKPNYLVVP